MFSVKCFFGLHRPVRSEVVRDGLYYSGRCKGCGKPIRRVRRGRWVAKPKAKKSELLTRESSS